MLIRNQTCACTTIYKEKKIIALPCLWRRSSRCLCRSPAASRVRCLLLPFCMLLVWAEMGVRWQGLLSTPHPFAVAAAAAATGRHLWCRLCVAIVVTFAIGRSFRLCLTACVCSSFSLWSASHFCCHSCRSGCIVCSVSMGWYAQGSGVKSQYSTRHLPVLIVAKLLR